MQTISLVLLGSPKIPFCRVHFFSSRTSRMRLIFCSQLSQLPENSCCYSTGQCCSPLRTARAKNRFSCSHSFVRRTIFWNLEFWSKTPKRSFLGRCCSATGAPIHAVLLLPSLSFLVRVARYANHFSSLLGSPKIPFCRVQFLSSRTCRMRLIFCSTQPTSRKSMLL